MGWRSPRPPPGSLIHSQDSACGCTGGWTLLWQKDAEQNQPREQVHGETSTGSQAETSKNAPSSELWQHAWNTVSQGSSSEPGGPWFLVGTGQVGTLCLARIKIPDSQKERGVLYLHGSCFLLKFPAPSQRPTLQAGLCKEEVSGTQC